MSTKVERSEIEWRRSKVAELDSQNIVVSLDDKYVGVILEEINDKILVTSDESEDHNRFEIPKCKIIMTTSSINKRMILDLEYTEILKYKMDYHG